MHPHAAARASIGNVDLDCSLTSQSLDTIRSTLEKCGPSRAILAAFSPKWPIWCAAALLFSAERNAKAERRTRIFRENRSERQKIKKNSLSAIISPFRTAAPNEVCAIRSRDTHSKRLGTVAKRCCVADERVQAIRAFLCDVWRGSMPSNAAPRRHDSKQKEGSAVLSMQNKATGERVRSSRRGVAAEHRVERLCSSGVPATAGTNGLGVPTSRLRQPGMLASLLRIRMSESSTSTCVPSGSTAAHPTLYRTASSTIGSSLDLCTLSLPDS